MDIHVVTYCHSALEKSVHNEVEIFIAFFLLKMFTEFSKGPHRGQDGGRKLHVTFQDPHCNLGAAVIGRHGDDGLQ